MKFNVVSARLSRKFTAMLLRVDIPRLQKQREGTKNG
jgi:hypothetical protein